MNATKWDAQTTDKAEIRKILEKSFAHVHQAIAAFPDADLDKKVNFFGHEVTARSVLVTLVGHIGEHLGQEIAYARRQQGDAALEQGGEIADPCRALTVISPPAPSGGGRRRGCICYHGCFFVGRSGAFLPWSPRSTRGSV